jgi:hypothetical protein
MSLHTLANHLQSAGRGEDKVLVHMTPGEVNGLQSLAMAHGGSLTINPETGLPEAGFLSSLLPMAIGFGLAPFTGGMSAALITGAGYTAATGSLKKGIMAGLGAYGGAGLGAGLSSLGTTAVAPAQAGLSPAVAANTSTLAGTSPLANVGAQPFQFTDDIFAGVAKAPVAGPGQSVVFNQAGAAATPFPTYAQTQANMLQSPMFKATPVPSVTAPSVVGPTSAYAPTSNFNVGQNLSGSMGKPYRSIELTDDLVRKYTPPGFDPKTVDFKKVSNWSWKNGRVVDPRTLSGASYDPTATSAASVKPSAVIDSTTSQPFAGGMQGQGGIPSNAVDLSGQTVSRPVSDYMSRVGEGAKTAFKSTDGVKALYDAMPSYSVAAGVAGPALSYAEEKREKAEEARRRAANKSPGMIRPYEFDYGATGVASQPYTGSAELAHFQPSYTALTPYEAPGPEYRKAEGGIAAAYAAGGPVEQMANMNYVGMNTGYPMASLQTPMYSNPTMQTPEATNVIAPSADAGVGAYSGEPRFAEGGEAKTEGGYSYSYDPQTMQFTQLSVPTIVTPSRGFVGGPMAGIGYAAPTPQPVKNPGAKVSGGIATPAMGPMQSQQATPINVPAYQTPEQQLGLGGFYDYMNQQLSGYGGYAAGGGVGGESHLGDYSDGGRLLKGPGDGVSDSIPASIGNRQPARLADGEFVVPARIVSELGNGSTEAGARKLYAMMDRVQKARRKTTGKKQVARNTKAEKLLPA